MQDNVSKHLPKEIELNEKRISNYEKDIELRNNSTMPNFHMTVNGKQYSERAEAAKALHKYIANMNAGKIVASMNGFDIIPQFRESGLSTPYVTLQAHGAYRVEISDSDIGTLTRIENFFKNMDNNLENARRNLSSKRAELETAKLELEKPFEHEQKILDLSSELAKIESELNLDKQEIDTVIDDEKFKDEKPISDPDQDELDEPDFDFDPINEVEPTTKQNPQNYNCTM